MIPLHELLEAPAPRDDSNNRFVTIDKYVKAHCALTTKHNRRLNAASLALAVSVTTNFSFLPLTEAFTLLPLPFLLFTLWHKQDTRRKENAEQLLDSAYRLGGFHE